MKFRFASLFIILSIVISGEAQVSDTLSLSLQDAEKIFLQKNLLLLAARYNIDAGEALISQAKLWDNPVLVTDQNVYTHHKWFTHGKNELTGEPDGQFFVQIQQLIRTAGKRGKLINLATTTANLSRLQLMDLLRNLRYQLRSDFYSIAELDGNHQLFTRQMEQLNILLAGMERQLQAGNIAQKEFLRVQALIVALRQDMAENEKQLNDVEAELRTLLGDSTQAFIQPLVMDTGMDSTILPMDSLINQARQHNPLYLLQKEQLRFQQQNLVYQKSLRVPDVLLGPEYDHNSNYTPYYVGLGISLPLPLWNRNQGNIKSAGFSIKQEETNLLETDLQLRNRVQNAYHKLMMIRHQSSQMQQEFYNKYEILLKNMMESYTQRQIGLVEFIDFFDAYKESQLKLHLQQLNLQLAKQELNFETGMDSVK